MKFPMISTLTAIVVGCASSAFSGTFSPDAVAPNFGQDQSGQQTESAQPAGSVQIPLQPPYILPSEIQQISVPEAQQVQSEILPKNFGPTNPPANN
jgi:hypothetical protein